MDILNSQLHVQQLPGPTTAPFSAPQACILHATRYLLPAERKCCKMRARDPLLSRSDSAPGQLGISRA